jgi:predicted MPP superfamily phosphohydrolase
MFLTFFSVVLVVMGGVHAYLFFRLVRATQIPGPWETVLGLGLVTAVLAIPLSFVASRVLDRRLARWLVVPAFLWLGFAFLTFFLLLAVDLAHGAGWLVGQTAARILNGAPFGADPERKLVLWRILAGAVVTTSASATAFGVWWALTRLAVRRVEVPMNGLPKGIDGFTIAHLSDLHLDLVHGKAWLASVVAKTNALQPDLVAITGDLAEGSVAKFGADVQPLGELEAPHGVFFVTGNHEYFHDLDGWLDFLPSLGVRVLRNERISVPATGEGFDLMGVDDHDGGRIETGHGQDLPAALAGRDPERASVLLAHQPRIMEEAAAAGIDLVLSGHTHGGQIWPFSYLVYLQQPYVRGLKEKNGTRLYLSSGTGFWGPPMRLGTTAEIALITLRSA